MNQRFLHWLGPLLDRGWLASQPADFIDWLAHAGSWRSYPRRHVLHDPGDEPDALYGLGSGALDPSLPVIGEEAVTIHRAEPGFWIGESAPLAHTSRSISVVVTADSRVFRMPAATIRAAVAERPDFQACFQALSHINITRAVMPLAETLHPTPQARAARMLRRLADAEGRISVTQADLARLIGMTRSWMQLQSPN